MRQQQRQQPANAATALSTPAAARWCCAGGKPISPPCHPPFGICPVLARPTPRHLRCLTHHRENYAPGGREFASLAGVHGAVLTDQTIKQGTAAEADGG